MIEFEEGPGYYNEPGFVKGNPLNNISYLEKCCEAMPEWADILRDTHQKLEDIAPGYNITQIKEKFSGLRYYWDAPEGWRESKYGAIMDEYEDRYSEARQIVRDAEDKAYLTTK